MSVHDNIRRIRQFKSIPQKALADEVGIPQGTLSKIEAGGDLLLSKLVKISEALGCELPDLFSFNGKFVINVSDKGKGVVIQRPADEKSTQEYIAHMQEEIAFLRKALLQKQQRKK